MMKLLTMFYCGARMASRARTLTSHTEDGDGTLAALLLPKEEGTQRRPFY